MNIPKPTRVDGEPGSIFGFKPGNNSNNKIDQITVKRQSPNILDDGDDWDDMYASDSMNKNNSYIGLVLVLINNYLSNERYPDKDNGQTVNQEHPNFGFFFLLLSVSSLLIFE